MYHYFVTFYSSKQKTQEIIFGSISITRNAFIEYMSDIRGIAEYIEKETSLKEVVILDYKELKGIERL